MSTRVVRDSELEQAQVDLDPFGRREIAEAAAGQRVGLGFLLGGAPNVLATPSAAALVDGAVF